MAHFRKRHILEPFEQILKFSRITGVIGHRQTGKSTFVESHSSEYFTLDDKKTLSDAKNDPVGFVAKLKAKKSAIDECQLVPDLFPALKVKIGTSSVPGRYILSGSVRFSSRNAIRESLAGRIVNQEMLPLVLTELLNEPNAKMLLSLFQDNSLRGLTMNARMMNSLHRKYLKEINKYSKFGGLPGVCFVRSDQTRKNLLRDLIETILDRDVRLIYPTTVPFEQIRLLCEYIAKRPYEPINYQEIKREVGLSPATSQKLVNALESVFLIRRISMLGDSRGEFFWFEDQLERHFFTKSSEVEAVDWLSLFYRNVRAQYVYRVGEFIDAYHFRTRGGAMVPLVLKSRDRAVGFFVVNHSNDVSRSLIHSAESFLAKHHQSRVVFVVKDENHAESLTENMSILPMTSLLFT